MELIRSVHTLIRFDRPFKSWIDRPLDIHDLRPRACVGCGCVSGPRGRLALHGHGVRERQQRGPADLGAPPKIVTLKLRRYICVHCHAVMTVAPALVRRKLFSAFAIAWALALFGLLSEPASQVRARVSPWQVRGAAAASTWRTLHRWAADAHALFGTPAASADTDLRRRAHRVSMALAARAGPTTRDVPIDHRAALGAAQPA